MNYKSPKVTSNATRKLVAQPLCGTEDDDLKIPFLGSVHLFQATADGLTLNHSTRGTPHDVKHSTSNLSHF